MTDNISAQADEVEALAAIYNEDWVVESEEKRRYVAVVNDEKNSTNLQLHVQFPENYPSDAPPTFELEAKHLNGVQKRELQNRLNDIYVENLGEAIMYLWIECIKEFLCKSSGDQNNQAENIEASADPTEPDDFTYSPYSKPPAQAKMQDSKPKCPQIFHGEKLFDRKSTFQAHLAAIETVQQADMVMDELLSDRKIAAATHNIKAYRVRLSNGAFAEDCVDDGETQAGSRVLHLLHIVDAQNVIVVVTRWYGGVHLGSDRFKHINKCARDILEAHDFIRKGTKKVSKNK